MGKKLAIRGHSTRGKEVIELLEMMGGKNKFDYNGEAAMYSYYVCGQTIINDRLSITEDDDFVIFNLEEFLEKYPFKVCDKIFLYDNITEGFVNGMKWDEDKGTVRYCVYTSAEYWCDAEELLKRNNVGCNVEEKDKNLEEAQSAHDKSIFMIEHSMWPIIKDGFLEYEIVDGYEFDKIENGNIILKPIKPKYPKTYEECCEVLDFCGDYFLTTYEADCVVNKKEVCGIFQQVNSLTRLLICKSAYWKIAGEEMGLGKPWEPDLEDEGLYCIQNYNKQIVIGRTNTAFNKILIFPSEEMKDAFYENFKDLIESCKELL